MPGFGDIFTGGGSIQPSSSAFSDASVNNGGITLGDFQSQPKKTMVDTLPVLAVVALVAFLAVKK